MATTTTQLKVCETRNLLLIYILYLCDDIHNFFGTATKITPADVIFTSDEHVIINAVADTAPSCETWAKSFRWKMEINIANTRVTWSRRLYTF